MCIYYGDSWSWLATVCWLRTSTRAIITSTWRELYCCNATDWSIMEYIIGLLQHTEGIQPMIFLVSFFSILLRIIRYFAEFECHRTHRVMEPDFIELWMTITYGSDSARNQAANFHSLGWTLVEDRVLRYEYFWINSTLMTEFVVLLCLDVAEDLWC